jgi:hypothetical protein
MSYKLRSMKRKVAIAIMVILFGIGTVQGQATDTSTPTNTPTLTPTPTMTLTPTPDFANDFVLPNGQEARIVYELYPADQLVVTTLIATLVSMWGCFLLAVFLMRRK